MFSYPGLDVEKMHVTFKVSLVWTIPELPWSDGQLKVEKLRALQPAGGRSKYLLH